MRAVKAKPLNRGGKKYRKMIVKEERQQKLRELLPKNVGHSSKKRHKNESLIDFKKRRKEANKRKRHAINKYRNSQGSARAGTRKLSRSRS